MSGLDFWDFDKYLLSQKGRIIHQIWFGTIPNKREAKNSTIN
jgi:glutathione peroxidase-family protein